MNHRSAWTEFVQYLQLVNKQEYREKDGVVLCGPRQVYCNHKLLIPKPELLRSLKHAGALEEIGLNYTDCRLRFSSEKVLAWLSDYGAWLELYLYAKLAQSNLADDAVINAVLSWDDDADDDDTLNEVDVMACRNGKLYLFSCKTGPLSAAALNELAVLAHRFGGRGTCGILATTARREEVSHAIKMRVESLGLRLMTREDLEPEQVCHCLESIFNQDEAVET